MQEKQTLLWRDYPLCHYFLSEYLSRRDDPTNFPPDEFPALFDRYEKVFKSALQTLRASPQTLKGRSEFSFDSGDVGNLESGIAVLRVAEALRLGKFLNISLVTPNKNSVGADLTCEKNGQKVCCEVKTITKQSRGRSGRFPEDQLYEKILENISKARTQLEATAAELRCTVKIFVCVVNWFKQSILSKPGPLSGRCGQTRTRSRPRVPQRN